MNMTIFFTGGRELFIAEANIDKEDNQFLYVEHMKTGGHTILSKDKIDYMHFNENYNA